MMSGENPILSRMHMAIVGATGAVGQALIAELLRQGVQADRLNCYASERSDGTRLGVDGHTFLVRAYAPSEMSGVGLAFLTAGSAVSTSAVPIALEAGITVIDNSSAYRMRPDVPLVVPEVNGHLLHTNPPPRLVANPNCSTAQLVCALAPLQRAFGLAEVVVSTYQSVSGTGRRALKTLAEEERQPGVRVPESPYPHPIARNVIPQVGPFDKEGAAEEEAKIREETRRLLGRPELPVWATAVRVPTLRGHGESVWVRTAEPARLEEVTAALSEAPGVVLSNEYTTPMDSEGSRDVFVGRIRRPGSDPRVVQFWVVSDNLLKGAAWNAVQIAEELGLLALPGAGMHRRPRA
jgi:aspartate-semialdehyde dehydrogenase